LSGNFRSEPTHTEPSRRKRLGHRLLRRLTRFRVDDSGNGIVEFAIVSALVFIPIVFGIIEFGRVVWAKNMVTAAAREGVRYAIVHGSESGSTADSAAIANYVKGRTQLSPIVVRPSWSAVTEDPGDTVTVTVQYAYTPIVKIPGMPATKTVAGTSKQIIAH
jgi:Flp pilus assembly protein TadG